MKGGCHGFFKCSEELNMTLVKATKSQVEGLSSLSYREIRKNLFNHQSVRFFYKYISLDSLTHIESIVCKSRLWFSSPLAFNDPFDMKWRYLIEGTPQEIKQRIREIMKRNPDISPKGWFTREREIEKLMVDKSLLENRIHAASANNASRAGVLSLTIDPRNILMWSHYADHHKGLVLQFEIARDPKFFMYASMVEYHDDYPIFNWVKDPHTVLKAGLFGKFRDWEYEAEARIIHNNLANTSLPFHQSALTGIILGCKFRDIDKIQLDGMLLERHKNGYADPIIYKAKQHSSAYGLKIVRN
jgi:hypothetical protein